LATVDQRNNYNSGNLVNQEVVERVIVIESAHVQSECVNGEVEFFGGGGD